MSGKYVPDLSRLQATCDVNYARLLKLLPDFDNDSLTYQFDNGSGLAYEVRIIECSRYTTTIDLLQKNKGMPEYLQPTMQVRLYHDVRMAEVLQTQHVKVAQGSYDYPNRNMHQPNEKELVNLFLTEWIHFCQQHLQSRQQNQRTN